MRRNPLKIGFIGGGLNSAVGLTHKIALEMDGRFDLVAGCFSRNSEINAQTALAWNVQHHRTYDTWQALVKKEKERLDAVIVLTPTPSHKDIVISCIEMGLPVVCEKALACDSEEVCQVATVLDEHKGYLAITYNYTGYPMVRELKHRIQRGELGKLEQIMIEMPQEGYARLDPQGNPQLPQDWRLHDGMLPTLSLDLGVHLHQLVDFLTEEKPIAITALNSRFGAFKQVVDNINGLAQYTNGLICNFWYGKAALGNTNGLRIRVFGENGSAEWIQLDPEHLRLNDNKGYRQIIDRTHPENNVANKSRYNRFKAGHPAGFIEAFANYYTDLAENLRYRDATTRPPVYVFGIDKALEGLKLLEAIHKAAKSSSWQTV